MNKAHYCLCMLVAFAACAHADSPHDSRACLRSGEVLTFVVRALGFDAGHLRIQTTADTADETPHVRIQASMATEGWARSIYKYSNESISIIDATTGRLLQTRDTALDGNKSFDRVTELDYATNKLVHTDRVRPKRNYQAELTDGLIDLSLTILCARFWQLAVGDQRDVVMTYEGELYDLQVTAVRKETVKTPSGKITAVVLEPKQRGTPKGAFVKGTAFRLYVSQEDRPRIVRFDSLGGAITMVAFLERVDEGAPLEIAP
jgi:hypothetical protein